MIFVGEHLKVGRTVFFISNFISSPAMYTALCNS
jgi:hypothetical protein